MAQTEEMKQLIKDGKIVGRKWTMTLADASGYVSLSEYIDPNKVGWFSECSLIDVYFEGDEKEGSFNPLDYDSFEAGIKVGDEWWFEGDRGNYKTYGNFTLSFRYGGFCIDFDLPHKVIVAINGLRNAKHSGNIHEEINDGSD